MQREVRVDLVLQVAQRAERLALRAQLELIPISLGNKESQKGERV